MVEPKEPVTIIVVTHNNWKYTKLLLKSLRLYTFWPYKVIVFDNNSTDETREQIIKHKRVKLIKNKSNTGYPKAVNKGLKKVDTEYFVLLNNDIVVSPDWLTRLLTIFKNNPQYWQLTTNSNGIIDKKDSIKHVNFDSWMVFNEKNKRIAPSTKVETYYKNYKKFCQLIHDKYTNRVENIESPFGFLGGQALMMRADTVNKIEGHLYDERFEIGYYEDTDLSWRIALAGGKIGIARGVFLHHFVNTTFDSLKFNKAEIGRKNKYKFLDKWEEYIKERLKEDSEGDLDKLKELSESDERILKMIEYFGLKSVIKSKK
jgi:GT2 family glycosyltransferase